MYILTSRFVPFTNNLNEQLIALASRDIMNQLNILTFGYIYIDNHLAIILCNNEEIKENEIQISEYLYLQLKDPKTAEIKKTSYTSVSYDENFRYNLFPNLPLCKEITITIINNENAKFMNPKFLKAVLDNPILVKEKQTIAITLNDEKLLQRLEMQNCEISLKCRQKITNCYQLSSENPYIQLHIDKIISDSHSDYYILDLKTVQVKIQEDFAQSYQLKSIIDLGFQDKIYQQNGYLKFKQQITNIIQLKKCITIGLESRKKQRYISFISLGKRRLFKQLACLYGIMYVEKDFSQISSLRFSEKLLLKIQDSPCLLFLRNFSKLEQILLLTKQHVNKEDITNELIKLIKRIKKQRNIILILSNEEFDNYPILKSYVDFFIRFYPNDDVAQLLKNHYNLAEETDQIRQLLKETTWRIVEKEILNNKDQYITVLEQQLKTQTIKSSTKMEDVGGMEGAIKEVAKTIILPQIYPELFDQLVKPRRGILFFGPPGTGKTLLAKCIATEMKMNFISVKGPEMLNQYIGQSESNIRDLFKRAKENIPSLVFFDELDALAPARGNQSDSNQVMDRIVAQLLTEIDNLSNETFIIGATNRPDLLDSALLRPGRFDKLLYLGIKNDKESRTKILRALCKSDQFDEIVDEIPLNMTGADFYGLVSQATIYATKRTIQCGLNEMDLKIEDLREALKSVRPSVSEKDLQKYEELRKKYE